MPLGPPSDIWRRACGGQVVDRVLAQDHLTVGPLVPSLVLSAPSE